MAPLFRFLRRFVSKDVSQEMNDLFNLCKKTIGKSALYLNMENASEDATYLMKRHQCEVLIDGLSVTEQTLTILQQLSFLDEKTIPVLKALHQVLMDAEGTIQSCSTRTSEFLRTAFEKGDMKETFQKLLYDVQWHTDLLHSILVDNSGESCVTFAPALCSGQLNPTDELTLLVAVKKDEEDLERRLSSMKLDDPIEQDIVTQFLKNMKLVEAQQPAQLSPVFIEGTHDQLLDSRESKEQSTMVATDLGMVPSSFDLVFLNPLILKNYYRWKKLGRGAYGEVRKGKLFGATYAVKMFLVQNFNSFDQEMAAIQGLGHHPHVLRPFFFSRNSSQCFLIMEKMDMELVEFLESRKQGNKLSVVEAVGLMLQIAEGMRHIHQKRMAHRDLKSGNILVSLGGPTTNTHSKVCTVKIADFGLTKTKNASRTCSGQTVNKGTTLWMAPEVINIVSGGDASGNPTRKATFNPRKADVYSFAIVCSEILTGEQPFGAVTMAEFKKQVKGVENPIRPDLPNDCPPRLASIIQRCWAGLNVDRPLFPEICNELRYIKGLLLRNDQKLLNVQDVVLGLESNVKRVQQRQEPRGHNNGDEENKISHVIASMECIKRQGPWGRNFFGGYVELDGTEFVERYGHNVVGSMVSKMEFECGEFIQQVSGSVAKHEVSLSHNGGKVALTCVASLTIHTNCRKYGPFGAEVGRPFTSGSGKVVGFHGAAGALLDVLGVWIIPDGQEDGDQSFLKE